MTRPQPACIGILYCGELGAALATLLRRHGIPVVTTAQGRSPETRRRAIESGAMLLSSLEEVVEASDVVVSLVLPSAALATAESYLSVRRAINRPATFVDANSIDIATWDSIAAAADATETPFADATIHGGAGRLAEMGVMYLSGPRAEQVHPLFEPALSVRRLGAEAGQAKRMKLLLGGLSKGLNLLFLEAACLSERLGLNDDFLRECREFYPGLMDAIERMLPTYPLHAKRRVSELQAVEALADLQAAPHAMITAARERLNDVRWPSREDATIQDIIRCAAESNSPLRATP